MPTKGSKKLDAKQAARLRRLQLEEEKRRLARRDRMRTWGLAGLGVLIGGAIIAAVVVPQALKPTPVLQRSIASFGVAAAKAGCDAPASPSSGNDVTIGPGSPNAKQTKGTYKSAPPVGGPHYLTPLPLDKHFYAATEHPKVEQLVANELQMDTVVWYLPTLAKSQVKTLDQLSQRMTLDYPNMVFAPWDTSYGSFPAGRQLAFATKGHVQYCAKVSGAATQTFVQRFPAVAPATSTPAPGATSASPVPTGTASPKPSGSTRTGHRTTPKPTKS